MNIEDNLDVVDAYAKLDSVMQEYKDKNVYVSYSGGSDSDTIMWMLRNKGYSVAAVFFDTGLEYLATKDHVEKMINEGFHITTIKPKKSIGQTISKSGSPFISKFVSEMLYRLQRHNFDFFEDNKKDPEELLIKFPNAQIAIKWWCNINGPGRFNIKQNKYLKEFLIKYGLPFKVSNKCCNSAKKTPVKKFAKENNVDMMILGIRKSEGGIRAGQYKNCFVKSKSLSYGMYFPIFWWNNELKSMYDQEMKIYHSKCYTDYDLPRTGCIGCPFGRGFEKELRAVQTYEPKMYKAINSIFSDSYEWTRKYKEFYKDQK